MDKANNVVLNGGDVAAGLIVGAFTIFYAGFGGGDHPLNIFAQIGRQLAMVLFLPPVLASMHLDRWRAALKNSAQGGESPAEDLLAPVATQTPMLVWLPWGFGVVVILLCWLTSLPAVPIVFGLGMLTRSGRSPVGKTFRNNPLFRSGLLLIAAGFLLELLSVSQTEWGMPPDE
jgi:hypothetical protein